MMGNQPSSKSTNQSEESGYETKKEEGNVESQSTHDQDNRSSGTDKEICSSSTYFGEITSSDTKAVTNKTLDKVKAGLYNVKVSRYDADQLQREIEGELFDKWKESCEVMEAKEINIENIQGFLDHLQEAYEGVDEHMRQKLYEIDWSGEWDHKIMEFKYDVGGDTGARYGMIVFGKSEDAKFVDCIYCLYKLDFKVAPQLIVTKKDHSALWGLIKWQTVKETEQNDQKRIQNLFRFKAVKGFYDEGLIDKINDVSDKGAPDNKK